MAEGPVMQTLSMKLIDVDEGRNVRKHTKEEVAARAASMEAVGLLQPVGVVKAGKRYRLLYGYCRHAAAKSLGWKEIPAVVAEKVDADFEAIALATENIERTPLTLRQETDAVRKVQAALGQAATVGQVAEALGKTPQWTAQRLALLDVVDEWWKLADEDPRVSRSVLYAVARLDPQEQREWVEEFDDYGDPKYFVEEISKTEKKPLDKVPWSLDALVHDDAVGPCNGCQYRGDQPLPLFPDLKLDAKPTCVNGRCYDLKTQASLTAKAAEAKAKTGKDVKILVDGFGNTPLDETMIVRGHSIVKVDAETKGAIPVISPKTPDRIEYVRPSRGGLAASSNSGGDAAPKAPKSDAERLKTLKARRFAAAVRSYSEQLPKLPCNLKAAVAFLLCWGTASNDPYLEPQGWHDPDEEPPLDLAGALNVKEADWHKLLFARVVGVLQRRLNILRVEDQAEQAWEHAKEIAAAAGHSNDLLACLKEANAEIKCPKSLEQAWKKSGLNLVDMPETLDDVKPTAKPAKKTAGKDRKKAAAGEKDE